jgi:LPXTG-site transpeptidase (sortase) family protein
MLFMVRTVTVASITLLLFIVPLIPQESLLAQADLTPRAPQAGVADSLYAPQTDDATTTADPTDTQIDSQSPATPIVAPAKPTKSPPKAEANYPATISIPAISLSDNVVRVGLTSDGAMDVPDGNTKNVGWYDGGTTPGDTGSAVMDAHVFAAFKNLRYLKVGGDIYVTMSSGKKLHFKVESSIVYPTASVPLEKLFNRDDGTYLNLITCAGHLTKDKSTYDHRLVVYAKLVK